MATAGARVVWLELYTDVCHWGGMSPSRERASQMIGSFCLQWRGLSCLGAEYDCLWQEHHSVMPRSLAPAKQLLYTVTVTDVQQHSSVWIRGWISF